MYQLFIYTALMEIHKHELSILDYDGLCILAESEFEILASN